MSSRLQLVTSDMFARPDDGVDEEPRRMVVLSVEGNVTEKDYFEYIEQNRKELGINASVHVYVLKRANKDTSSAPSDVLELLQEYVDFKRGDLLPDSLRKVVPSKFSDGFIKKYLSNEFPSDNIEVQEFERILTKAGIDYAFSLFKENYDKDDIFGVVVDRDYKTHTVEQLKDIIKTCEEKGYKFFITNPLFEFWLLLHVKDISELSSSDLEGIRKNDKVSCQHTFTSKMLSDNAGHTKHIKAGVFKAKYLNKVNYAIEQAKRLGGSISDFVGDDTNEDSKMGKIGTNLPDLFELLREK